MVSLKARTPWGGAGRTRSNLPEAPMKSNHGAPSGRRRNEVAAFSEVRLQKGGTDPGVPVALVPCLSWFLHQLRRLLSHRLTQLGGGPLLRRAGSLPPGVSSRNKRPHRRPDQMRSGTRGFQFAQPFQSPPGVALPVICRVGRTHLVSSVFARSLHSGRAADT